MLSAVRIHNMNYHRVFVNRRHEQWNEMEELKNDMILICDKDP